MKTYNVRLESSEIVLADEEVAVLNEYKEHRISATELCEKLAQYGLQVDVTDGIVSFEVEL